ncbi:uncharacterized protein LOC142179962 [Nicotiana tabacum]|uniref:Uncharacterized protein LOC142179962 n=1 Tax=Nicotiana tabacum TaxID=4097 RepID=A0AC58UCJ4_TOBAC
MAYLTRRFQKMVHRNGGIPKRGSSSKPKNYDLCHKCSKPGQFIKDFPLLKKDQYKNNTDKAAKRNQVTGKCFKRKNVADNVMKQALAAWGDSSSESEEDDDQGDNSMIAVESEAAEYDSIFALMAQSDNDEDDDDDDEVNFLDVQRNQNLINDKNALNLELGEAEQSRDELVVVVVDLKETIECLKKEKDILTKNIANVKHERYDLVVVVVDLKETIKCVKKEKEALTENVASIEHVRDDLLVVVVDLKDTIEEVKEKEELGRVKSDLEKSIKWTWSSDAITTMYTNNGGNRQGIGFQMEKTPYNPHSKYVIVPDNWLCTHYGNTGHFKETCKAKFQSQQKNKVFAKKGAVKGSNQQWYMDSSCSKHMAGSTIDFLSLKALQGGSPLEMYNLLSVSQIRDKGNKVEFVSKICTVTNLVIGEVVLVAKRYKNIYVADFESLQSGDLSCLSDVDDDAELWHRRLGHASFSLLNKLVKKDLVRGLPKSSFKDHKVCDACAKGKHVRSSFKPKKEVSTSKPLDLLHIDLCGPLRVPNRGGKRTKDETFQVFVAFVKKIQVKVEEVNTACYLINNCMIRSLLNKTPYELLNGRKPKLTHLRTFGCKCFVLNNGKEALGKFDAKSDKGIFLDIHHKAKPTKYTKKELNMLRKAYM